FELGGKNAALVFADSDFEAAVSGTMRSVFSNCGQVCLCSERVYVERPIHARFVDELARRARRLKIGGPYEGADMGPLISRAHRVARQMEVGMVWVNDWYLRDLRTPFGGVKLSGLGREGGMHSLAFFSAPMNICVKL